MYSSAPGVVKRRLRYARRFSSVDSTPIVSKRFLIVPVLSSAARIPFPSATSARRSRAARCSASQISLSRLSLPGAPLWPGYNRGSRGSSSVGRALASQAKGRGFESRLPLPAPPRENPRYPGVFLVLDTVSVRSWNPLESAGIRCRLAHNWRALEQPALRAKREPEAGAPSRGTGTALRSFRSWTHLPVGSPL